jgi:hypothetical protein
MTVVIAGLLVGCAPPAPADVAPTPQPTADLHSPAMRRLSVAELRYALGDLLGVDVTADLAFPDDPTPEGFDNQVTGAAVSPQLLAQIDLAAGRAGEHIASAWTAQVAHIEPVDRATGCEYAIADLNDESDSWWIAFEGSKQRHTFDVPAAGPHAITLPVRFVRGNCPQVGEGCEALDLDVELVIDDGAPVRMTLPSYPNGAPTPIPRLHTAVVDLSAGEHAVAWRVLHAERGELTLLDPSLRCYALDGVAVDHIEVHALDPRLSCDDLPGDDTCLIDAVAHLAERAWRGPLDEDDRAWLTALGDELPATGNTLPEILSSLAHAIYLSPRFLFVREPLLADGRLEGFSLAEQLALALWSSVPDEALLACAADGRLVRDREGPCALAAQVDRMMADPRFERFVTTFAHQWLQLEGQAPPPPDDLTDPESLVADMRAETLALVRRALTDPALTLRGLQTEDRAALTPALARWYGLDAGGEAVDVGAVGRAGLLGQAAIHQATSRGGRVLPVYRGVWIRNAMLCDPPTPPPPGVPMLSDTTADAFDAHTRDPACASCHRELDPLGAALTRYDAWGREVPSWSTPSTLPDGTELPTVADLSSWLADDPRYVACSVSRLATRLTSRTVAPDDALVQRALRASADPTLGAALRAVLLDDVFRRRTTEAPP